VLLRLAVLSAPPFVLIAVFAPWLFGAVFGPDWVQAGVYARIMLPWLWVRFLSNPLGRTKLVFERNRLALWNNAALAVVALGTVLVAWQVKWSFEVFLTVLSVLLALTYGAFLFVNFRVIKAGE